MSKCQHPHFKVKANVFRLTDGDDGPVTGFTAEITVKCVDCEMPFEWLGVAGGSNPFHPMRSVDGFELRAPITPAEEL